MLPTPRIDFERTPVTLVITAVALAIELVCTFDPDGGRRNYLYNELQLGIFWPVWEGQLWRPFTTTLLHGSLLHAAFNIYWMITLGTAIENHIRSARYLVFIIVVAYFSTMFQFYLTGLFGRVPSGMVGLSGVVYGLFGLMWIGRRYVPEWRWICNDDTVRLMIGWFFFCFVISYIGMPIANWAHAGGLIMGYAVGGAVYDRNYKEAYRAATGVLVVATIASLFVAPGHTQYEALQQLRQRRQIQKDLENAGSGTMIRIQMAPVEEGSEPGQGTEEPPAAAGDEKPAEADDDTARDGV